MSARSAITLVARREIRERLRSRAFLFSTLFLLVIVGASAALSAALKPEKTYRVAVTAPAPRGLGAALRRAATPFDATVRLRVVTSAAVGREDLAAKHVDALLLLRSDRLVFRSTVDAKLAAVADTAVLALRHRLPPAPELATASLEPPKSTTSDAAVVVAMLGSTVMLLSLSIYGQWVLVGVVEEKSNRVVELILSTVRSRHLLAGKVIGIGLLG
ncbi:MAG TPA: ABC transporter permease, partial [Gaiellaceae bacterium]|nr:ABC transporter permease [Gaiellaceae bacterium]